ncbi:MAG: aldolase/citrate lyase family protein [Myxococcota bacterium]|nr:aldolase/citrate lyase family protein [Myxococcota bacterium]
MKSLLFLRRGLPAAAAARVEAPWCIADLEDSVPEQHKPAERRRLVSLLESRCFRGRGLMLRVNGLDRPQEAIKDLQACLHPDIDLLILPMLTGAEDVRRFDQLVSAEEIRIGMKPGALGFLCLLERPAAILEAKAIVGASPRVKAAGFGHADFLAELGGVASDASLAAPRSAVVMAARAHGIPAIASPYLDFRNERGFVRECQKMKELGFQGIFAIHPGQDAPARKVFAPSAQEEREARELVGRCKEHRGIVVHKGKMAGPPMLAKAEETLRRAESRPGNPEPISVIEGRVPRYGLDLSTARVGQAMECPAEITVDAGWRALWQSSFPSASRIHSSTEYARAWGLDDTALPFGMLLNLTLCLAVEPFSESCRLHLGLENARQEACATIGDTFRGYVRIDRMTNTSRGDASVIRTTHILVNQRGERVFRLSKDSYYDIIPGEAERAEAAPTAPHANLFGDAPAAHRARIEACSSPPEGPRSPLSPGEVILHPPVRPIGISENLLLTTLFRNTHPVHSDTQRFGPDGLIVCGGFVQSLAHACSEREFRPVLDERLERSHHINPVAPGERVGAVSRVLEIRPVSQHLEEVRVHTLGLREVDVTGELAGLPLPAELFSPAVSRPSEIQALCREHCPALEDKIALRALRVLLRTRSG